MYIVCPLAIFFSYTTFDTKSIKRAKANFEVVFEARVIT